MAVQYPAGIPRTRRTRGLLLDAITRFNGGFDGNPLRWLEGVSFRARACADVQVGDVDPCADDTLSPGSGGCDPWYTQMPFEFLDVITTSTLNMTASEVEASLRRNLNESISWALAKGLTNVYTTSTRTLATEAHAPDGFSFGSSAVSVRSALAIIENELAQNLHDATGMIHVAPGMLSEVVERGGMVRVDDHWETPTGHTVVADSGYRAMPQPSGQSAPAAATDWIYGSGPVVYELRSPDLIADGSNEIVDIAHNDLRLWMYGAGILLFDPCPVTAVLASYGT